MRTFGSVLALMAASLLAFGCTTRPDEVEVVSIDAVSASPEAYLGRTVQLTGSLENRGTNYFTDLDLAIVDGRGHYFRVRPWLPLEAAPGSTPLAQFLGKPVALTGIVVRDSLRNIGITYLLEVQSATLLV